MSSLPRTTRISIFPVEVSGWDQDHTFFLEKAQLHWWSESSRKQIALTSAVPHGAIIFLRFARNSAASRHSHRNPESLPYHTEFLDITPDGRHRFRLHSLARGAQPGAHIRAATHTSAEASAIH
jgi:hypothetical protein